MFTGNDLLDPPLEELRGLDVAYRRLKKRTQVRSFAHRQDKPPLTTETLAELLATLTDEHQDTRHGNFNRDHQS